MLSTVCSHFTAGDAKTNDLCTKLAQVYLFVFFVFGLSCVMPGGGPDDTSPRAPSSVCPPSSSIPSADSSFASGLRSYAACMPRILTSCCTTRWNAPLAST